MIATIIAKETKLFFRSPMAYFIAGLFSLIVGWLFYNQLAYFAENVQKIPVSMRNHYDFANEVVLKLYGNVNFLLLFIAPIISMRSFSEEYKTGTIQLLIFSHCSQLELVIGKYISLFIQGTFLLGTTLIYPFCLGNLDLVDNTFILTGYLGLLLNLAAFLVLGAFASSLSKNVIVSSLLGFVFVFISWMMAMFSQMSSNYIYSEFFNFISVNHHFENFVKANISIADFVFYMSFISFFIILIKKRIALRSWQ